MQALSPPNLGYGYHSPTVTGTGQEQDACSTRTFHCLVSTLNASFRPDYDFRLFVIYIVFYTIICIHSWLLRWACIENLLRDPKPISNKWRGMRAANFPSYYLSDININNYLTWKKRCHYKMRCHSLLFPMCCYKWQRIKTMCVLFIQYNKLNTRSIYSDYIHSFLHSTFNMQSNFYQYLKSNAWNPPESLL